MVESHSIRLDSTTTQEPTGGPPASQGLTQSEAAKRKFFAFSRRQQKNPAESAA